MPGFLPRYSRKAVWIKSTLNNPMFSFALFGHWGPVLRNKAFLGTVIDMAQMSFLRFLANQKRVSYLTLRQWLGAILSAEHVNFPLNSTKRKQAAWKLCISVCRDLELGPWLVNTIINDPCISDPAPWIDFTSCLTSSWDYLHFLETKTIYNDFKATAIKVSKF